MARRKTNDDTHTIVVWNDEQLRIRRCNGDAADHYCELLRELLHGKSSDDERWQIIDSHLEIDIDEY